MAMAARTVSPSDAERLAVVLHDLAWLVPRMMDSEVEAELESLPPSEVEVMRLLVRRPGLSLSEVADELSLQPSNASTTVRGLVARGLVERRADESDGRITRLIPTAEARQARTAREQAWGRLLQDHLSQLRADQAAALAAVAPELRALADQLASRERS